MWLSGTVVWSLPFSSNSMEAQQGGQLSVLAVLRPVLFLLCMMSLFYGNFVVSGISVTLCGLCREACH